MHLINIKDLSFDDINKILNRAKFFKDNKWQTILKNKSLALLFFEPSTRTRLSFELAAKQLGMSVLNMDMEKSSLLKGEAVHDTLQTIEAMGVDGIIMRCGQQEMIDNVSEKIKTPIINAGAGTRSHPSQALLDAFTILQHKQDLTDLKMAIVGDIKHSRVAHSNIDLLTKLGAKSIHLVGPKELLPEPAINNTQCYTDFDQGIADADVVMLLRMQKERMQETIIHDFQSYHQHYGLKESDLKFLKKDTLILHPGPMNRGIEISDAIAEGPQSVILEQVKNGVFVRMAILEHCLA